MVEVARQQQWRLHLRRAHAHRLHHAGAGGELGEQAPRARAPTGDEVAHALHVDDEQLLDIDDQCQGCQGGEPRPCCS